MTEPLESLWDDLLSRQRELIEAAFEALKEEEREAVVAHLRRMVDEADWHPEQRLSALTALEALDDERHAQN